MTEQSVEKSIVIIAGNARSLIANRGDLIRSWDRAGHQITALVPKYDFDSSVKSLPINLQKIGLDRVSVNPLKDISSTVEIIRILGKIKPDVVFSYTVKPVVYGSIAARIAKVPQIFSMITGLGFSRTGASTKQRFILAIQRLLFRVSLKFNEAIFFQNPDDMNLFQQENLISSRSLSVLVNGSGVNLKRFPQVAVTVRDKPRFVMIARLLVDKGVREFVEAATLVGKEQAEFVLVGPHDQTLPSAIPLSEVEAWLKDGVVQIVGGVSDVRPTLANSSIFVLPSYREGTPRAVLEAMATGRPIITTDAPGCRETVIEEYNGFLIPTHDVNALANAMKRFIQNPNLIKEFGSASRRLVEEKYDVNVVNQTISETMKLIGRPEK